MGSSKRGAVTVYEFNLSEEGWQKRGSRIEGEEDGDNFGSSVVISNSGDSIAVGAYLNDGTGDTEGQVSVYDWDGNSWSQRGNDIDGENQFDYSGYSFPSVPMATSWPAVLDSPMTVQDGMPDTQGFSNGLARVPS